MKDEQNIDRIAKAKALHQKGFNCAQAVFSAYADLYDMDEETALKISTSFGGGLGGMRHVCGAVSGMAMIVGLDTGTSTPQDREGKAKNYEQVRLLAEAFEKEHGSIVCSELLGLTETDKDIRKKPCSEYIEYCAKLLDKSILDKE